MPPSWEALLRNTINLNGDSRRSHVQAGAETVNIIEHNHCAEKSYFFHSSLYLRPPPLPRDKSESVVSSNRSTSPPVPAFHLYPVFDHEKLSVPSHSVDPRRIFVVARALTLSMTATRFCSKSLIVPGFELATLSPRKLAVSVPLRPRAGRMSYILPRITRGC